MTEGSGTPRLLEGTFWRQRGIQAGSVFVILIAVVTLSFGYLLQKERVKRLETEHKAIMTEHEVDRHRETIGALEEGVRVLRGQVTALGGVPAVPEPPTPAPVPVRRPGPTTAPKKKTTPKPASKVTPRPTSNPPPQPTPAPTPIPCTVPAPICNPPNVPVSQRRK